MWHHPKYYKELRKRNRDLSELQQVKLERSVPQSDQVISSGSEGSALPQRAPGPGLKQQAIDETVPHNDIEEACKHQATSFKHQALQRIGCKLQAPSSKHQASSRKHQAPGSWTLQKVSRTLNRGPQP